MAVRVQDRSPVCIASKREKLPPMMYKVGKVLDLLEGAFQAQDKLKRQGKVGYATRVPEKIKGASTG